MRKISYWANCSAVGDLVCTIPVIKALIREDRLDKVLVPPKFAELYPLCDIPEEYILPITKEEIRTKFHPKDTEFVSANNFGKAGYRLHLIDLFSVFSLNAILKPEEKEARANPEKLPKYAIQEPYIVIGIGYAVPSRKMPLSVFKDIVEFCKKSKLAPVLLGAQRQNSTKPIMFDDYPTDGCINLIGKTSFAESISIMAGAKCVVGVDSGLIHLASLTDAPIVCGYTYVDPYYRAPFRKGSQSWRFYPVDPKSDCRYCSNGIAMFGVEFDSACPHGKAYECSSSLDGKDFIKALKKALSWPASQGKN